MSPASFDPLVDPLVERLLAGDADADDPEVVDYLANHPAARAQWEDLRTLAGELDRAGDESRATLDEARATASPPGLERVGPVLHDLAREEPLAPTALPERPVGRRPPGSVWPSRLIGIAAAILITVSFVWQLASDWTGERGPVPREVYLGQDDLELVSPRGPIRAWASFRWTPEAVPGGWFTLEIWDNGEDAIADPIVRMTHLVENEWTPSNDLPEHVRLRLRSFASDGEMTGEVETELSLSR